MAEYKTIKGTTIQSLASDPPTIAKGQIWYNTTTGALRAAVLSGTWASGPAFPANISTAAGCVSTTAA